MDIIKTNQKKYLLSRAQKLFAGVAIVVVILGFYTVKNLNQVSISRSGILLGTVKNGNLEIFTEGYGTLKSARNRLITSLTRATVINIILKPGARVSSDSIVAELENPELLQIMENAHQQLLQERANLHQLILSQKRQALIEKVNIEEVKSEYQAAKLKRVAEEGLIAKGIVAKNTYLFSVLREKQLKQRIELLKTSGQHLIEINQEVINMQTEKIKQQEGKLKIAQQRANSLLVTAGMKGVLQRLPIELGQSLAAGQEVALIGSVNELVALIKVPQSKIQRVAIGQKAEIDTRRDIIVGKVTRIDPVVNDNSIIIEVSLPDNLPPSALPQASVDAKIIKKTLNNINYIERPSYIHANDLAALYKLDESNNTVELQEIRFGQEAGRFIEIKSKVVAGDKFVLTDLSGLKVGKAHLTEG